MAAEPLLPNASSSSGLSISQWMRQLNPIRNTLWSDGNARIAHQELAALKATLPAEDDNNPSSTGAHNAYWELVGYACWRRKNYRKAAEAFERAKNIFLCGYMHLLSGDVAKTLRAYSSLPVPSAGEESTGSHWGLILLGLVTGNLQRLPTVLQMRQHLERDVAHLALAGQQGMLNQLCQYVPVLVQVNTETYKFIGRGLLNSGHTRQSLEWLLMSHQMNSTDPEVYYHLGEAYADQQQFSQARRVLNQCLMMTDQYPPASTLLETLGEG